MCDDRLVDRLGMAERQHGLLAAGFDRNALAVVELDEACRRQQLGEGWFPTLAAVPGRAISMSVRQIMKSAAIVCTVPDERKAAAVERTLNGPVEPQVPASILQRHQNCEVVLDAGAAVALKAVIP